MSREETQAKAYAEAFFSVAARKDQYLQELDELSRMLSEYPKFLELSKHPVIAPGEKQKPFLIQDALSEQVKRLVCLLIDKKKLGLLPHILNEYRQMFYREQTMEIVNVKSAFELNDGQKDRLKQSVNASIGKQGVFEFEIDKRLVCGIVIKIGDKLVDSSIKRQLDDLRRMFRKGFQTRG